MSRSEAPTFRPSRELYPFTSRWLATQAGRVHYIDEGQGAPIVLLHGNPTWSFLYRNIVRDLRADFRCIVPDYPGFGLSERPAGFEYTPREHAAVVREIVDRLGLKRYLVMGQDWGGPIGMALAASAPERVAGIVAGNTWFWPTDRFFNRVFSHAMSSRIGRWAILERNIFVERLIPAGTTRTFTREEMAHYRGVQPERRLRIGVAEFPRQLTRSREWLRDLERDVRSHLRGTPALLVWGMRDVAFAPSWCLPRWQDAFPLHELVELPNASHYIQEDAPTEIAAAIRRRFAVRNERCSLDGGSRT